MTVLASGTPPGGATLLAVALAPLLLAALRMRWMPRLARRAAGWLFPWAALPALALLAFDTWMHRVDDGALPWLLLGMELGLTDLTRVLLLPAALLWLAAAQHARGYLAGDPQRDRFELFFLATCSGNLGLLLARDLVSFYVFFALMTFAAYGLVVHAATAAARRAGRVYIVLAVLGEGLLLAGLLPAAAAAGDLRIERLPAAIAAAPQRDVIVALLYSGFGVKAGAGLLHVWLPLAHPVAPTPASAVLSGAMIKAGLLGWLQFLPLGAADLPVWGAALAALGLAAAFYAVVVGLAQDDPKTILAYSSVSQMGLMTLLVGAGLADSAVAGAAVAAAAFYALHHGLAKGALFFGVSAAADPRLPRALLLSGLGLPALALAGAPWTSGAMAKAQLGESIGPLPWAGAVAPLLYAGAIGTTLLMARVLVRLTGQRRAAARSLPDRCHVAWAGAVLASLLAAGWSDGVSRPAPHWSATWPLLVGLALAATTMTAARARRLPALFARRIPPGDLLVPLERLAPAFFAALRAAGQRPWRRLVAFWISLGRRGRARRAQAIHRAGAAEQALRDSAAAIGLLTLLLVILLAH